MKRLHLNISGIVQGVGFRPYVYNLAKRYSLSGWVLNAGHGVEVEIEGKEETVEAFVQSFKKNPPPLAVIDSVTVSTAPLQGESGFVIKESLSANIPRALVSPDVATCPDCLAEITNQTDRRYGYPFTNCTNCGPRYTIIKSVPYDRANTTMASFIMCPACRDEYGNHSDRRFHAQPNACPACGPHYRLLDKNGKNVELAAGTTVLQEARRLIAAGYIVAVKGIGGWHLAADAKNSQAVNGLRARKVREYKPLAVMAGSLSQVKSICHVSQAEEELLTGPARPIVLLAKSDGYNLSEAVAPGNAYVGVMLPYAPIHHLLLSAKDVWVMTSGNVSDEPSVYQDNDALSLLSFLTDYYLIHNREIYCRADDSLARVVEDKPFFLRRSRGFTPAPAILSHSSPHIFAAGGELKNTFCLTRGKEAFLSAHMGDLENLPSYTAYIRSVEHLAKLLHIQPEATAYDPHPEYLSSKYALATGLNAIPVQHHHAHIAAVLTEHHLTEPVIGVAFDGSGYGDDGNLWGGEFLIADLEKFTRTGHCRYSVLPGGATAIKEPWRPAIWMLSEIYGKEFLNLKLPLLKQLPQAWKLVLQAASSGINSPLSSSAGRLFDIAAALIDVRFDKNYYEGQAAVELELLAQGATGKILPYKISRGQDVFELDFRPVFAAICESMEKNNRDNTVRAQLAADFHATLAFAVADMAVRIRYLTGIKKTALSGGVFQNITLLRQVVNLLKRNDFAVYLPRFAPPNDGGLSLGQAAVAGAILVKYS